MSSGPNTVDLSSLPPEARALIQAQQAQIAALSSDNSALATSNKRLGDLVKELRHALRGKKSEKLTEDERQLAFEDLSIAVAEVEEAQEEAAATPTASRRKRKPPFRRLLCNRLSGKGQSQPRQSAGRPAAHRRDHRAGKHAVPLWLWRDEAHRRR